MYEKYIVCLLEHSKKHQLEEIVDSLRLTFTPKTLVKECLYLEKDDHYLLLFPVIEEATASYSKLYDRLSKQGILSISKEHSILEIPSAYKEAKFAYSCQELMQNNQIFFEKTGILQLFFTSENELAYSFIRSYYDDLIQPLVDYDDLKKTELVKTLQMYINHDLNIYHTAQHLYIHENTLRSRIRRIESITSRDLQKMHDLFQVMLGLYLHKFYSRNPS